MRNKLLVVFTLALGFILINPVSKVYAGTLTGVSVTATSYLPGTTATYTITFTTETALGASPDTVPQAIFAAAYDWTNVSMPADYSVTVDGSPVVLDAASFDVGGGYFGIRLTTPVSAGSTVVVTITDVINPSSPGSYPFQLFRTSTGGGSPIDEPLTIPSVTIAAAATCTWTGAASSLMNTSGNWTGCGGSVPTAGDTLIFPLAASEFSVNNDIGNDAFDTLQIDGVYNFTGGDLHVVNLIQVGPGGSLFNSNIESEGVLVITSEGNLEINGDIEMNSFDLELIPSETAGISVFGEIDGSNVEIRNRGLGIVSLFGSNSFVGNIVQDFDSRLALYNSSSLGNVSNVMIGKPGATIQLHGGLTILNNFDLNGSTLQNFDGDNEIVGNVDISISTDAAIDVTDSADSLTLSGILSGSFNTLTKQGPGDLNLTGTNPNTFFGDFDIDDGTVYLNKTAGVNALSFGSVTVGDSTGLTASAQLILAANDQLSSGSQVEVNSDGLFNMNGNSDSIDSLNTFEGNVEVNNGLLVVLNLQMIGGNIDTGSGTIRVTTSVSLTGGFTNPSTINGTLDLGNVIGGVDFNGANSGMIPDGLINATITGGSDINFLGGDFDFAANNTATGNIVMDGGYLVLEDTNAFNSITQNSGFIHINGDSSTTDIIQTGGSLWSNGGTGNITYNSIPIFLNNFTVGDNFGIATVNGDMSLDDITSIDFSIDGTVRGTNYSALNVTGTLDLGGSSLAAINYGFVPAIGDQFIIAEAANVVGTFRDQPNGSTFIGMNGIYFIVTYTATEVILTAAAAPVELSPTGINLPIDLMLFTLLLTLSGIFIYKKYEN